MLCYVIIKESMCKSRSVYLSSKKKFLNGSLQYPLNMSIYTNITYKNKIQF